MTAEQATALVGAITALVIALGALYREIRGVRSLADRNHDLLNGRIGELINVSVLAAKKQGELEGRDWERTPPTPPQNQ